MFQKRLVDVLPDVGRHLALTSLPFRCDSNARTKCTGLTGGDSKAKLSIEGQPYKTKGTREEEQEGGRWARRGVYRTNSEPRPTLAASD
ncbi:hypothetical protein E2C01_013275 [Portunus trituberculatus]|uniref:Uncharacterized protein n=1 Tax=Portunus trituberculatus TaxID=210409 RepID=A0A5B7DGW6_PORTR|nr:hypothetical protein [Portunus trituberculatus]